MTLNRQALIHPSVAHCFYKCILNRWGKIYKINPLGLLARNLKYACYRVDVQMVDFCAGTFPCKRVINNKRL